jgi:hypothetical protein
MYLAQEEESNDRLMRAKNGEISRKTVKFNEKL